MHQATCMDFCNYCCAHFSACIVFLCLRLTNYGKLQVLVSFGAMVLDAVPLEDVVVGGREVQQDFGHLEALQSSLHWRTSWS